MNCENVVQIVLFLIFVRLINLFYFHICRIHII